MVGQLGDHAGRSVDVLLLYRAFLYAFFFRDQHSQALRRSGKVVVASPKGHALFHRRSLLAKRTTLSHQRGQSMTESFLDSFNQTRADFHARREQLVGPEDHLLLQAFKSALLFLFNQLCLDQFRRRLNDRRRVGGPFCRFSRTL